MKKWIVIGGGILGVGVLAVALFVYSNVQEPQSTVEQNASVSVEEVKQLTEAQPDSVVRKGNFIDGDAVHKGSGVANIVVANEGAVLKFEEDFSVTNGPDLFVYLSPNANGDLGEFVSLGELQAINGAQVYSLPDNHADFKRVVIWCRAFGVEFASAELN